MKQLYQKSELTFSIILIVVYVFLISFAENYSISVFQMKSSLTAPISVAFGIAIYMWINKKSLNTYYGLCNFNQREYKKYLYFLPLVFISSSNLWNGVTIRFSNTETILYVLSMIAIAFLEEVIFRGFLFKALAKKNVKMAIIVSSLTFGFGHIFNLFNGAETAYTLLQICYATGIGFLFSILFYKGKSLLPCIIAHATINSLSAFVIEKGQFYNIATLCVLIVVSLSYSFYILRINGKEK